MIRITDLTKRFDGKPAVDRLCATLPTGSVYGIVGSNGAGKSTLLRLTAGVYKPDGGEIALEGEPVYGNPAAKGKIAFLPDVPYFLPGADLARMERGSTAVCSRTSTGISSGGWRTDCSLPAGTGWTPCPPDGGGSWRRR